MISRAELKDSAKPSPKSTPKMPDELGITIRGDRLRNAMKLDYFSTVQVSNMRCIKSFVARNKMSHL
jgi:hypothetical protein